MTTTTATRSAKPCPVEAVIGDLARVLALQARSSAPDAEVDAHREGVLEDRERALLSTAATSRATSLKGAALQIVLAGHTAADMGAALMSANVHGYEGRESAEMDRAAEAMTRSAYAALSAAGGVLPQIIVERYMPLECDVWAALAAVGDVPRAH